MKTAIADASTGEVVIRDLTADEARELAERGASAPAPAEPGPGVPERVAEVLVTAPELGEETRGRLLAALRGE